MSEKITVLAMQQDKQKNEISVKPLSVNKDEFVEEICEILDCENFDLVEIKIKGKTYGIYCDDEFLLRNDKLPSLYIDEDTVIFGNLLFTITDEKGFETTLNSEDIKVLVDYIKKQDLKLSEWCERRNAGSKKFKN